MNKMYILVQADLLVLSTWAGNLFIELIEDGFEKYIFLHFSSYIYAIWYHGTIIVTW